MHYDEIKHEEVGHILGLKVKFLNTATNRICKGSIYRISTLGAWILDLKGILKFSLWENIRNE